MPIAPKAQDELKQTVRLVLREAINELVPDLIEQYGQKQPARQTVWLGKPGTTISAGSSGTFSIYSGTAGSETDTARDIEDVFCRNEASPMKMHALEWIDGHWEAFQIEC